LPAPGLTMDDLAAAHKALLGSGLPIGRVNAVRKHLSALKGGGALRLVRGKVVVLLLSDVPGDDPSTIASGPFAADPTTYADALQAIESLGAQTTGLDAVHRHLTAGARGELAETLKPPDSTRCTAISRRERAASFRRRSNRAIRRSNGSTRH